MKRVLIFCLLAFASTSVFGQIAATMSYIKMDDGDTYVNNKALCSEYIEVKEDKLASSIAEQMMNHPLLKAFEIQKFKGSIKGTIKYNIEDGYDYNSYDGGPYSSFLEDAEQFRSFYKSLMKNQKTREVIYGFVSDAMVGMCKMYPSDFAVYAKDNINRAISFVESMPDHVRIERYYEFGTSYDVLLVDGANDRATTFDGFIARRILMDDVPAEEILSFLRSLIDRIDSLDLSDNPSYLYAEIINNEVVYLVSVDRCYYVIGDGQYVFTPYEKRPRYMRRSYKAQILCSKDEANTYYTITQGYERDGEFVRYTDSIDGRMIIVDSKGNLIHQE